MNLIDAIRSGRPFRRGGNDHFITVRGPHFVYSTPPHHAATVTALDVTAKDWELEPEIKVTLTPTIYREVLRELAGGDPGNLDTMMVNAGKLGRALGLVE